MVSLVWPELPAGVKFDPTDMELLEHLQGKSNLPNSMAHVLINQFIPTIQESEGICYTHPENLPGMKMDGSSCHFFHKISNAYASGPRKRRRINNSDHTLCDENIRWHKTGKSKPVCDDNGVQKGWKKILTLHAGSKRGGSKKIDKTGWVMHQYHLGVDEAEMDGEFVVCKVFYQPLSKKIDNSEMDGPDLKYGAYAAKVDPRTPTPHPPQPCHLKNSPCETEPYTPIPQCQGEESGASISGVNNEENEYSAYHAGLPQVVEEERLPDLEEPVQAMEGDDTGIVRPRPSDSTDMDAFDALSDLENTLSFVGTSSYLGTFVDLQFGSQDSLESWWDSLY
ncbi:hypothetical protein ACP4OV_011244 [Aristida adscensionis]